MSKGYMATDYHLTQTGVKFTCQDAATAKVFADCEALAKQNIKIFGDRKVMQEGAKYSGVWLETQPMGGEMYATRDMEVALNNQLVFMMYQRRDGRMPGMIRYQLPFAGITVHQDWMQGDFFTRAAYRMYWFIGEDREYLKRLYESLRDFDNYLWQYRDSDGDGCLESWCVWDTGEDNCSKYQANGVKYPDYGSHCGETAPVGHGKLPYESAEYMAYSYSHRAVLAKISDILGNGEGDKWREAAKVVQDKVKEYLWSGEKKAVYDRDCDNKTIDTLTLENIKCMYHGLFTQEMADEFIKCHLFNPDEFFTPLPLCYIAANDPLFYVSKTVNNFSEELKQTKVFSGDVDDNSWSGPVEGLTVQRSIDALLNYGHHAELGIIGKKWIANLAATNRYVQQYDPFTGKAAPGMDGYGPTILAALEYITYLYGIDFVEGKLIFSCSAEEFDSEYTQTVFGHTYTLKRQGNDAIIEKDGVPVFTVTKGTRIVTDLNAVPEKLYGMETSAVDVKLNLNGMRYEKTLQPNEEWNNGERWGIS